MTSGARLWDEGGYGNAGIGSILVPIEYLLEGPAQYICSKREMGEDGGTRVGQEVK